MTGLADPFSMEHAELSSRPQARPLDHGAGAKAPRTLPSFVVGGRGLLAGELMRLLLQHPALHLHAVATRDGGEALAELHPHLAGGGAFHSVTVADAFAALEAFLEDFAVDRDGDPLAVLFFCLPHGASAGLWSELRVRLGAAVDRLAVVDLAADYRLRSAKDHERWYGTHADAGELSSFVYGLPELSGAREELPGARRIAAPGCFATALQLASVPLAAAGVVDAHAAPWTFHAITGSSGSGAKPSALAHHPYRNGNVRSYAHDGHRHEAELLQALRSVLSEDGLPEVVLQPMSGPYVRGIHLTATLPLASGASVEEARQVLRAAYEGSPFVEVCGPSPPELRAVVGANRAQLGCHERSGLLFATCALDNVLKGGAGQAVQALNLALRLPEATGLPLHAMGAF